MMVTMVTCMGNDGYNGYMHGESRLQWLHAWGIGYNGYMHGELWLQCMGNDGYNGYMHGE